MLARCLGWCASVEMTNLQPLALAARISEAVRSSRSGLALISRYTLLPRGRRGHRFEIERKRIAMQQHAAGGMAQHAQMRAFERAQQAVRHLGGFQIHVAVHAADHQIQLAQRVVFQIHRAVAADVALDAGEHAQPEARSDPFRAPGARRRRRASRPGRWPSPGLSNDP